MGSLLCEACEYPCFSPLAQTRHGHSKHHAPFPFSASHLHFFILGSIVWFSDWRALFAPFQKGDRNGGISCRPQAAAADSDFWLKAQEEISVPFGPSACKERHFHTTAGSVTAAWTNTGEIWIWNSQGGCNWKVTIILYSCSINPVNRLLRTEFFKSIL